MISRQQEKTHIYLVKQCHEVNLGRKSLFVAGCSTLYGTHLFLETNSFLNSSKALSIVSTSAMCSFLHCGQKQPSCPGRTSHQFDVHVYIRRYGNWTETNEASELVFFSVFHLNWKTYACHMALIRD